MLSQGHGEELHDNMTLNQNLQGIIYSPPRADNILVSWILGFEKFIGPFANKVNLSRITFYKDFLDGTAFRALTMASCR